MTELLLNEDYGQRCQLLSVVQRVKGVKVNAALHTLVSQGSNCTLSMRAAEILADRGDTSALPKPEKTVAALAKALCMSRHDSDSDSDSVRAIALSRSVVHATRGVIQDEVLEQVSYEDYDDELGDGQDDDQGDGGESAPERMKRAEITEALEVSHDDRAPTCNGNSCETGDRSEGYALELTFETAKDGVVYLREMVNYRDARCGR